MFTYSDWDGNLTETRIDNLDLRWEMFLQRGQIFSVSAFYKKFDDPTELVRIPEQQTITEYQTRNVGDGQLFWVEVEFRKDLDFIAPAWNNFNLSGNQTVVESQIDMTSAGLFRDIYIKPFHSLNKKIGKDQNTAIELKVSNLLDSTMETYYQSCQAEDQPNIFISPGRTLGIGLSTSFYGWIAVSCKFCICWVWSSPNDQLMLSFVLINVVAFCIKKLERRIRLTACLKAIGFLVTLPEIQFTWNQHVNKK